MKVAFDVGNSTEVYKKFKDLIGCDNIEVSVQRALEFIQLFQIGKMEKRLLSSKSKSKSSNDRWFRAKKVTKAGPPRNGGTKHW